MKYLPMNDFVKRLLLDTRVHNGCGLDITGPRIFYHGSLQIRASTKMFPPEKYPQYGILTKMSMRV